MAEYLDFRRVKFGAYIWIMGNVDRGFPALDDAIFDNAAGVRWTDIPISSQSLDYRFYVILSGLRLRYQNDVSHNMDSN